MTQRFARFTLLAALFSVLAAPAFAQIDRALQWRDTPPPSAVKVGDTVTLVCEATIAETFHIYSSEQPANAVLPAAFALDRTSTGVELVGAMEEAGERRVIHDAIFEADIAQFDGKVIFSQRVKITAPDAKIAAAITYQVCDDSRCIPGEHKITYGFKTSAATPANGTHGCGRHTKGKKHRK